MSRSSRDITLCGDTVTWNPPISTSGRYLGGSQRAQYRTQRAQYRSISINIEHGPIFVKISKNCEVHSLNCEVHSLNCEIQLLSSEPRQLPVKKNSWACMCFGVVVGQVKLSSSTDFFFELLLARVLPTNHHFLCHHPLLPCPLLSHSYKPPRPFGVTSVSRHLPSTQMAAAGCERGPGRHAVEGVRCAVVLGGAERQVANVV